MNRSTVYVIVFIFYILSCLGISAWVKHREQRKDREGFLLGDRSIGPWPIAFSFVATLVSSSLFMGSGPKIYQQGWSFAIYGMMFMTIGVILSWVVYARPLSNLTDKLGALTITDLLAYRYNSKGIRSFSSLATIIIYIPLMGSQLVAAGKLFQAAFGLPYRAGIVIVGVVLTVATALGGFKSVVYNDFFQGIIMYGIFLILVPVMLVKAGGFSAVNAVIAKEAPEMFAAVTPKFPPLMIVSWFVYLVIGLGLGQPSLLVRYLACKDEQVIKRAFPLAVTCHAFGCTSIALVMTSAFVLFPGITDRETVFPTIVGNVFPPVLGGLALCAVFACMMSTVDSQLLVASSCFSEDIYKGVFKKDATERQVYNAGVISTIVIGIGGILTALYSGLGVLDLIILAESCLIPIYLFSVCGCTHFKRLNAAGVLSGMITGAITAFVWELKFGWDLVVPVFPAVVVCAAMTFAVSYMTKAPDAVVVNTFFGDGTKDELIAYNSRH